MEDQGKGLQHFFITILMCGLVILFASVVLLSWQYSQMSNNGILTATPIVESQPVATVTPTADTAAVIAPATTATALVELAVQTSEDTLQRLESSQVPENDLLDLARRFNQISNPRVQLKEQPAAIKNGSTRKFWILEADENYYRQVNAKLIYQTEHLYFWVEDGIKFKEEDVRQLSETFENQIYPTTRNYFGSEWTPGVDNDPHLFVIYARGLGSSAAGYFAGSDSLMPEVRSYSNVAEMFYLSADYTDLKSSFTYGVLAHEFQHMIHWNHDRNETSWINEGFSELAAALNGYDIGGFDFYFAFEPDLQLNFWPGNDQGDSAPHYGASYLFARYLLAQFGADTIKEIVANPKNGFEGLDDVLADKMESYDSSGDGAIKPGDRVFQNWVIANILQNDYLLNGIYGYGEEAGSLPVFYPSDELNCTDDTGWLERTVNQYGTDYIHITCDSGFKVELEGNQTIPLMPVDPFSGQYYFWSNTGDESHMTLSREFDFTQVNTPIELSYWTWYDIERDYDYLYLTASTDGINWQILEPTSCTRENPTGANYSCGYNGLTDGWINEKVDLSPFAGQKVKIQFEYLTDAAVNGEGFLIDDISVNAVDYFSNFEEDDGGWEGNGFVRISNLLPQTYAIAEIRPDFSPAVNKWMPANGLNQTITVENNKANGSITLAINGLTRFTHIPAGYQIRITRD
jgi:immune inhibitor A